MIPPFTEDGLLPPGDHPATLEAIRRSHLIHGPEPRPPRWDSRWRSFLIDQVEILARQLWDQGVEKIFLGGSFVESVEHPNDIDGVFECHSSRLPATLERLNAAAGDHLWTFTTPVSVPDPVTPDKLIFPMQRRYRVHLEPSAPDLDHAAQVALVGGRLPLAPRLRRPNPLKRPEIFARCPVRGVIALQP